jgi:hypothetical protein
MLSMAYRPGYPRPRRTRTSTLWILLILLLALTFFTFSRSPAGGQGTPTASSQPGSMLGSPTTGPTAALAVSPSATFSATRSGLPPTPFVATTTYAGPAPSSTSTVTALPTGTGGDITAYFTCPAVAHPCPAGWQDPLQPFLATLNSAQKSIDMAMYNLNLQPVAQALLAAKARGVSVRLVTDSDALDGPVLQDLKAKGVPVLGDGREALMHDKFTVIDGTDVWTGSLNLTETGLAEDNNNLVRLRSIQLAQDYSREFEEMFVYGEFGPGSPANTPFPQLTIGAFPLQVYFSPEDGVLVHVLSAVRGAKSSIHFLAYSFTSDDLGQQMLAAHTRGVAVAGVFETAQERSNTGTEYTRLKNAGLDVRLDGNPGQMHHKVIIIDRRLVIFGSYNFSASAEKENDENLIILDDPAIAEQFESEFQRVSALASP